MSCKSLYTKEPLVQSLITSYFPVVQTVSSDCSSHLQNSKHTESLHIEETPQSKIGVPGYYYGRFNGVDESPTRVRRTRLVLFDSPCSKGEPEVHSPPYSIDTANSRM